MSRKYQEHDEQVEFFRFISYIPYRGKKLREFCFAVPNGGTVGGRAAAIAGARRRAEGLTPGVPDVECFVASKGFTGLHIEFKRVDGVPSDVKKEQRDMMDLMRACGRKCEVAFGAAHAWKILAEYLDIKA